MLRHILLLLLFAPALVVGQQAQQALPLSALEALPALDQGSPVATFTENKGQWPDQVLYRARIPGGCLYVERGALTFSFATMGHGHHHHSGNGSTALDEPSKGHAYRVEFVGGQASASEGGMRQSHYENYFLGNDPERWGSNCAVYGQVVLKEIWPGIDLVLHGRNGLKYDLVVAPGADPAQIRLRYSGQDALMKVGRQLLLTHSLGQVSESEPVAFLKDKAQFCMGGILQPGSDHETVACEYILRGNELSFAVEGSPERNLVIDPVLTFSSYSGSTSDNFGFTATYDEEGHLYGGGIVFTAGYPSTPGVFDPSHNGGVDVGISKWSPNGATLVWSTYLGGSGNETPHSLVTNLNNELYVMGSTGSSAFPVTAGAFRSMFQGGPGVTFSVGYGVNFPTGVDLFVTHLNQAGNALIGSTYMGGTGTDGVNTSAVAYNYGDAFRGEIALDPDENPVVVSCTSSLDIPTTPGAPQTTFGGGGWDAFVFRMDPALSNLLWGTYHGGSGAEVGNGVQFDSQGRVFIAGGTNSSNLPMAGIPLNGTNAGGVEGYVARYSADGTNLLSATYLGTSSYDQCFFVQIDTQDDVYVVGQTRGDYPVSPLVYNNPGSSQFIHKLNNELAVSIWSTRIGNGSNTQDLSPSAFLVSDCGQIYFSGWGGTTNNLASPTNSTTNGSPITPDAFQSTTNGSDFYLMVLEPDAASLSYGTFFGGGSTADHVDGGTSRFDKNGKVYQAVCAGCGGSNSFPTTPGAWSTTNNSSNCNLGVFKFDLNIPIASIDIDGPSTICFPDVVQFVNNSTGGNTYLWNFGDGNTSTDFAPAHTYTQGGTFTVSMIMTDVYGCSQADTAAIVITSVATPQASVEPIQPICPGANVQLVASEGTSYEWFPAVGLSSTTVQNPIATPPGPMTYFVVVTTDCGSDTASVDVTFADPQGATLPDTTVCLGSSVLLGATGGVSYLWSPAATLNDPTSATPLASPTDTTTYSVLITTVEGCEILGSLTVNVVFAPPSPVLSDTTLCTGASVLLSGPDADSHSWAGGGGIASVNAQSTQITPGGSGYFWVTATNTCGSIVDSVFIQLVSVNAQAWPDTLICPGNPVPLIATGGVAYEWSPQDGLNNASIADPVATVTEPTTFTVVVTDALGCIGTASATIGLLPPPVVQAGADQLIDPWGQALLQAFGNGTFQWSPSESVQCDTCAQTWAQPSESTEYTVTLTAGNGCTATARILVILNGSLFVPNTFTPNGDGVNDLFGAWGTEIAELRLMIFNRWGEMIFESNDMNSRWNGTYNGVPSPIDTYVWKVEATELSGYKRSAIGHVNLVR